MFMESIYTTLLPNLLPNLYRTPLSHTFIRKMTDANKDTFQTDPKYDKYLGIFPFPLSPFQKQAIQAIVDGDHALVCAPTGSGKTLPAEFAIRHFTALGKRVIYCSPIKALSNQKKYEFTKKYGDEISFGLLTGDTKTNPGAQVLIMTTEILMNKLFMIETPIGAPLTPTGAPLTPIGAPLTASSFASASSSLTFDIDIDNDLGAVVFDEVHMINSPDRGHVWEKCIMMLPNHVQMVMLSATLDNPQKFANWIKTTGTKDVVLCQTHKRIVPLTHYVYLTSGEGLFKKVKDKETQSRARASLGKCLVIQDADGKFSENTYREAGAVLRLLYDNHVFMKRKAVLNELFAHLNTESMLPAIAFVFSRKHVELCAEELTIPLLDENVDPVPYVIRGQCDAFLRRLANWREYSGLPEYEALVRLLERGIGIHHSGMIPVLREIVEFMIAEKRVKVLFATESFAIGLDCPIKTAVFLNLKKHDGGETPRYLLAHEYTQMAGRAGRRGLDTIGNVVHCSNLFDLPPITTYKELLSGTPQRLTSKFKIYYPMVLNVLSHMEKVTMSDVVGFARSSMLQGEIELENRGLAAEIADLEVKVEAKDAGFAHLRTPREKILEYVGLIERLEYSANKKRKEVEMALRRLREEFQQLEKELGYHTEFVKMTKTLKTKQQQYVSGVDYVWKSVEHILNCLVENEIICVEKGVYRLTEPKGVIASRVAEIHPVLMANTCELFMELSSVELAAAFSLFTDVRVSEDIRIYAGFKNISDNVLLNHMINLFNASKEELYMCENRHGISVPDEDHCYDIVDYVKAWCECEDEGECREVICQIGEEKGVSVGDFSKALLKISTISRELMGMCGAFAGDAEFTRFALRLSKIDELVLKYIVTNQSLYL